MTDPEAEESNADPQGDAKADLRKALEAPVYAAKGGQWIPQYDHAWRLILDRTPAPWLYAALEEAARKWASSAGPGSYRAAVNTAAVAAALREFDGDWDRLANALAGVTDWSASVTARTLDDDLSLTDSVAAELNPQTGRPVETWLQLGVLAVSLYVTTWYTITQTLGPDAWEQLRDETTAFLGVVAFILAVVALNRR